MEEIGEPGREYVSLFRLDLESRPVATEIRIHAYENGKFHIPAQLRVEKYQEAYGRHASYQVAGVLVIIFYWAPELLRNFISLS